MHRCTYLCLFWVFNIDVRRCWDEFAHSLSFLITVHCVKETEALEFPMNWFLVNVHLEGYLASVTSDDLSWENENQFSFNLLRTHKEHPEVLAKFYYWKKLIACQNHHFAACINKLIYSFIHIFITEIAQINFKSLIL